MRVTSFTYDAAGNVTRQTQPDGIVLEFEYDLRGRTTQITDNLGQSTRFVYDAAGNVERTETRKKWGQSQTRFSSQSDVFNRV